MALRRYASAIVAFTDCRDTYARLAGMALSDTVSANQRREDEIREIRDSIRMFRSTRVKTANPSDTNPYVLQLESRLRDLEKQRQSGVETTEAARRSIARARQRLLSQQPACRGRTRMEGGDRDQAESR